MTELCSHPHPSGLGVELLLDDGSTVVLQVYGEGGQSIDVTEFAADLVRDGALLALDGARDPAAVTQGPDGAVEIAAVVLMGTQDCTAKLTYPTALPADVCLSLGADEHGNMQWPAVSSLLSLCVAMMLESSLRS